jgi:hypothetical protein
MVKLIIFFSFPVFFFYSHLSLVYLSFFSRAESFSRILHASPSLVSHRFCIVLFVVYDIPALLLAKLAFFSFSHPTACQVLFLFYFLV